MITPSNNTLIRNLHLLSIESNRYFGLIIFIFGSVGNLLNIFVLSQRSLRSNPCALLFLVASVSNLLAILSGLTSRILAGWNLDISSTLPWLCKLRAFITFPSRTAAYWLIAFATIDRWLLSSIHWYHRRTTQLKNVQRSIVLIVLCSMLVYSYAPICYEITVNHQPIQCHGKSKLCRISIDLIYGLITVSIPVLLMNVFSVKTLLNTRRAKRDLQARHLPHSRTSALQHRAWKSTDHRLLLMLLVQVFLYTFFAFPFVIQRIYSTMTLDLIKSDLQYAIENFLYNFLLLLSFIANGIPFYIYTLSGGQIFRRELRKMIDQMC